MDRLRLRCTLLTDVILNYKSASEGNNKTLDFIPGNTFLGIVASKCYGIERTNVLFHSGKVKFGDAHISDGTNRSLKIAALFYYPKLYSVQSECYVYNIVPNFFTEEIKEKQLKQCRTGYYCFNETNKSALEVTANKNFFIKSAHDKNNRTSKNSMMYGYESLEKGTTFCMEISFDDEAVDLKETVKHALIGKNRIGRSRTAQYGLVNIEEFEYEQPKSAETRNKEFFVYADGRLIFLDKYGMPTFTPTAKDLGIEDGEICWDKSQIRTFAYAPWNFKRQTYDAERCGIEKGSVFVVKTKSEFKPKTEFVGIYQNEGFGKVIYNPDFLQSDNVGKSIYEFKKPEAVDKSFDIDKEMLLDDEDETLLIHLRNKRDEDSDTAEILKKVNRFVFDNYRLYNDMASQWGQIRTIAMNSNGDNVKYEINKYLNHGIAANEWNMKQRANRLNEFIDSVDRHKVCRAVVNLASEMAKKIK